MSTVILKSEASRVDKRLSVVLQGRQLYPWGYSVGLSKSAIGRLKNGHFPDPETLIPACRIERMSLSWLLDGLGVPFVVYSAETDGAGAVYVREMLRDEPTQQVTFVHCALGYCVVLWQPVEVTPSKGEPYHYTAVEVIGGGVLGPETARAVTEFGAWDRLRAVDVCEEEWAGLTSGRLGNVPLLGPHPERGPVEPTYDAVVPASGGGWVHRAQRFWRDTPVDRRIRESRGHYPHLGDEDSEVLWIFRGLEPCARETVLKMMRALRR